MDKKRFNILVLDGGGSKGVYTLGVLRELELKLGKPLYQHFDLIYGTSTGSIIGSLIAIGKSIDQIQKLYFELIPVVMNANGKKGKSEELRKQGESVFKSKKFNAFKTNVGIVALNYDTQMPLVFKSNINQAHAMKQSFEPGFGCTIAEAVQCSCSAYPVFDKKQITISNQGSKSTVNVIDGGFIANNATLFAIVDAHKAFGYDEKDINVLSVGVGNYIEKPMGFLHKLLSRFNVTEFVQKVLVSSTNTNVILTKLLYPNLNIVRVNDSFPEPEYGTNMIEADEVKLSKLVQLGRQSYAKYEKDILKLLAIS